jgi:membrane protease YdiL (CAAX protease family)
MRAHFQPSDTTQAGETTAKASFSSYSLFLPYFLPYAAYVVIANLPFDLPKECNYTLRLLVVPAILAWGWGWYLPLCRNNRTSASVLSGIVYGSVGVPIWVLLCKPFAPPDAPIWDMWGFLFRLAAACTIVPIAEEYLFRGYVFRLASLWRCLHSRPPGLGVAGGNGLWHHDVCSCDQAAEPDSVRRRSCDHKSRLGRLRFFYGSMAVLVGAEDAKQRKS